MPTTRWPARWAATPVGERSKTNRSRRVASWNIGCRLFRMFQALFRRKPAWADTLQYLGTQLVAVVTQQPQLDLFGAVAQEKKCV